MRLGVQESANRRGKWGIKESSEDNPTFLNESDRHDQEIQTKVCMGRIQQLEQWMLLGLQKHNNSENIGWVGWTS